MKIYSKSNLFAGILWMLLAIFEFRRFYLDGMSFFRAIILIVHAWIVIRSFRIAFSKENAEKDRIKEEKSKRAAESLFGSFAPCMPYIEILFLVLAIAPMSIDFEKLFGISILLWIAAIIYPIWYVLVVSQERDRLEEEDARKEREEAWSKVEQETLS